MSGGIAGVYTVAAYRRDVSFKLAQQNDVTRYHVRRPEGAEIRRRAHASMAHQAASMLDEARGRAALKRSWLRRARTRRRRVSGVANRRGAAER